MEYQSFYAIFITFNVTITLVVMLAACLCCKKKNPKNEFMGLEGMVKLKNPDDHIITTADNAGSQNDLNLSTVSNVDSEKRASNAPHRSLPDIPVAENNDNGSELYETVAEKRLDDRKTQDKSPTLSTKKQSSVSQHSSISQADDVSSPYSRVKNSPHDYAKVCSAEHPYAQLNAPITNNNNGSENEIISEANNVSHSSSNQNLLHLSGGGSSVVDGQQEIPAASAIAGMVSASQDLPYMTPPIASQQLAYFSGDSQDSSKGYTSISVREPLANILGQTSKPGNAQLPRQPINDSHYATVSDDSDETYAAIEDPNSRVTRTDIYTSGSETYAQIQPMSNPIVVAVEINTPSPPNLTAATGSSNSRLHEIGPVDNHRTVASQNGAADATPIPPPVDSLRAQMHSRQASSSSNNSSMGNLGSPKPEKRQANSPLPPTPKNAQTLACSNNNLTSGSSAIPSGRNSVASVIEFTAPIDVANSEEHPPKTRNLSPSKDIEGMYAKVMKKSKFANTSSSQNNSPILSRKLTENNSLLEVNKLERDVHGTVSDNSDSSNLFADKIRARSNSYSAKDHGYETIPADVVKADHNQTVENRKSDCYANILQKERLLQPGISARCLHQIEAQVGADVCTLNKEYESLPGQSSNNSDPGYETLKVNTNDKKLTTVDCEPNYEVLKLPKYGSGILTDDGYAKVLEKPRNKFDDTLDGYSKVKGDDSLSDGNLSGYSTIQEAKSTLTTTEESHNYASISETTKNSSKISKCLDDEGAAPLVSKRYDADFHKMDCDTAKLALPGAETSATQLVDLPARISSSISSHTSYKSSSNTLNNISTSSRQTLSSNYESLTGSESDPNYESVCYLNKENSYERLQPGSNISSDTQSNGPISPDDSYSLLISPTSHHSSVLKTLNGPTNTDAPLEPSDNGLVDDYFHV